MIREKTGKVIRLIVLQFQKLRLKMRKKPSISIDIELPLIALGTQYGGWKVPAGYLRPGSTCYLAGAGIDISFDVEVAENFGCDVQIIDPTPQALQHFKELLDSSTKGEKLNIGRKRGLFYQAKKESLDLLHFHEVGLWSEDTQIRFYVPSDTKTMVSHSIVNLHKTEDYFEASVVKLSTLMKQLGHSRVDFLKLDIEGAEYEVIRTFLREEITVNVLAVEFDEVHHPLDNKSIDRIEGMIDELRKAGYRVVDVDEHYNVSFVHERVIEGLKQNEE